MLTQNLENVLEYLLQTPTPHKITVIFKNLAFNVNVSENRIEGILQQLANEGYIYYSPFTNGALISVLEKGYDYRTYKEADAPITSQAPTFNITNPQNSIIGTQETATININTSISELRDLIARSNSADKEELSKAADVVEMVANGDVPLQKGILSKFADVMNKNPWFSTGVTQMFLHFITKSS
jgi:hypothetical protein